MVICPGVSIGVAACGLNKKQLTALFNELFEVSRDIITKDESEIVTQGEAIEHHRAAPLVAEDSIPSEQSGYDNATAYMLALVTVADGIVDDDELAFASEFIQEEDSVVNKDYAVSTYNDAVIALSDARNKSNALFKIRANKLFSKISEIDDDEFLNRVSIMLEGMVEAAGGLSNVETVRMVRQILSRESFLSDGIPTKEQEFYSEEVDYEAKAENDGASSVKEASTSPRFSFQYQPESTSDDTQVMPDALVESSESTVSLEESAGEATGLKKYWPRVERFVIGNMLDLADETLQKPEELVVYFSKIYELLPIAVRLVVSQEKFVDILMARKDPLIAKVQYYKTVREQGIA